MTNHALIGDVHSQAHCLKKALDHCRKHHLRPILLGDLFDSRCPNSESVEVYHLAKSAQCDLNAIILQSNHQHKLIRYLKGNRVVLSNGLDTTVSEFENSNVSMQELYEFLISLPYGVVFQDKNQTEYRAAHAFFSRKIDIPSYTDYHFVYETDIPSKIKNVMLYGPTGPDGRILWWNTVSNRNFVRVAGHYHMVHIDDQSHVIDGECGDDKETAFLPLYDISNSLLYKFQ